MSSPTTGVVTTGSRPRGLRRTPRRGCPLGGRAAGTPARSSSLSPIPWAGSSADISWSASRLEVRQDPSELWHAVSRVGNALDFLCNGFQWKAGPLSIFDGTAALRSFDLVYQLLPAYGFVGNGAAPLVRVSDLNLPNLDPERAAKAMEFHDAMTRARVTHADDEGYAASGTKVRPVVGISQPTWQSAVLAQGKLTLSKDS